MAGTTKSLTFSEGVAVTTPTAFSYTDTTNDFTLNGKWTFADAIAYAFTDVAISSNTFARPSTVVARITSGTGPLNTITSGVNGDLLVIQNKTGGDLTIANENAANGFTTGTAADLTLADDASLTLIFNSSETYWSVIGGSGGGGASWTTVNKTTTYTAALTEEVFASTSGGGWTLTLPAGSAAGDRVRVIDENGTFGTANLSVATTGGDTIQGNASPLVIDVDQVWAEFVFDGTSDWRIIGPLTGIEADAATGGEINYIANPNAESGTTGYATYDDGASATPVDGTGGTSANLTLTAQATTILRGSQSFKLAKDAADAQGEGLSYDFTIDKADQNKLLKISFDYNTDGTYANDDMVVYIYDVTNATLITPSATGLTGWDKDNDGSAQFLVSFSSTDSTSYRLCFHVATTSASAYDFYFDNVIVGPGSIVTGAAIGPWETFTPSFSGLSGASWQYAKKRRVGDTMEISLRGTSVTSSGTVILTIPDSLTIADHTTYSVRGRAGVDDTFGSWQVYSASSTTVQMYGASAVVGSGTYPLSSDVFHLHAIIPIAEWAGSGTVNIGTNRVEYISNSGSTTTAGGTNSAASTVYGPDGSNIIAVNSTTSASVTSFIMTPQTPLQPTDVIELQINIAGGWGPNIYPYVIQSTSSYGIRAYATSTTAIYVQFGNKGTYPNNATYAGNGGAWSGETSYKWRVVVHKAGIPVGFGLADNSNAGLVPKYSSGTFTPTLSGTTNVAALTPFTTCYLRIGNTLLISGGLNVDPTSAATQTVWNMTLPFTAAITSSQTCGGTVHSPANDAGGSVYAHSGLAKIEFSYLPTSASNQTVYFSCMMDIE